MKMDAAEQTIALVAIHDTERRCKNQSLMPLVSMLTVTTAVSSGYDYAGIGIYIRHAESAMRAIILEREEMRKVLAQNAVRHGRLYIRGNLNRTIV